MGGKPTVQGGMTKAEQDAALKEQREYEKQATMERDAKLAEYENKRAQNQANLIASTKQQEQQLIYDQRNAEQLLSKNISAMDKSPNQKDNASFISDIVSSLYEGIYGSAAAAKKRPK